MNKIPLKIQEFLDDPDYEIKSFQYDRKDGISKISLTFIDRSAKAVPVDFFIRDLPNGGLEITKDGETYAFGRMQSSVIRQLYEVCQTESPWLHGKTLLKNAGSNGIRIGSLFIRHPNWKELIIADRQGYYRLFVEQTPPSERLSTSVNAVTYANPKTSE